MNMSRVFVIQKFIIIACHKINPGNWRKVKTFKNKKSLMITPYLYIGLLLTLISCSGGNTKKIIETPTRGDIKIIADESFKPLIETEVSTFTQIYNYAKIKPVYKSEVDVINDFMRDSVKVIVTSRRLSEDQVKYLRDTLIIARTTTFAYDALALITNLENKDTLLNYNSIKDIFLGKKTTWKEIDPKSKLGKISVIFDNTKSGNIRYFREKFEMIQDKLPENLFAVESNPEVIEYVTKNKNALGIISMNWISDKDDSTSMSFKKKVNIIAVSHPYLEQDSYYRPDQGFIYDKSYPFVREIYLISRETFAGLGSGFISWACAEQGQRIVLKSGLVPATMPIRLVQIKK
jgi:phosphate transport system substrate-binding protein